MFGRGFRIWLVVASLAAAMVVTAQPVLADTELGHTGTVGAHSLNDTAASPGATCKYRYLPSPNVGKLVRIAVHPPKVKAVAGKNAQTVGWKFTVQRKIAGLTGSSPWENRYTSPEMTAVTDDAHNAAFTKASVRVEVPFGPNAEDVAAFYRVKVKMFWHRADDSVQGTALHRIDFYKIKLDTGGSAVQEDFCGAYELP
jgi:hypothetical protein